MIIIAAASGTSADGIDVGVLDLRWGEPGEVGLQLLDMRTEPWPEGLGESLLALLPPATTTAARVCELDTAIGQAVGAAARRAMTEHGAAAAELVVSPGQTVHHDIRDGVCVGTLQLGQPAWVVEATGLPVVSDLRTRDVSAGGHGAPLASTLDALWLAGSDGARAALNLGGIANVTVIKDIGEPVLAWDTGPANCLLDVAAHRVSGGAERCDRDGRLARAGAVDGELLQRMLSHPYFKLEPPTTTGRETFSTEFLDSALGAKEVAPTDLLATLTELTAASVAQALTAYDVVEVVASGGGTKNPALMEALRHRLGNTRLVTSDERGLPATAKEVAMWGLLGFLTWHGVPGSNSATGARERRVLGRISPGDQPLVLPPVVSEQPRRLHVLASSRFGQP